MVSVSRVEGKSDKLLRFFLKTSASCQFATLCLVLLVVWQLFQCLSVYTHDESVGILLNASFSETPSSSSISIQQHYEEEKKESSNIDDVSNSLSLLQPKPLMIQWNNSTNEATTLQLLSKPLHYVTKRKVKFWHYAHSIGQYKTPEGVPEGCVAEAEWASDHHPACNDMHEVDMNDYFFKKSRNFVRINGHKRRKKFRMIGRGGFRAAFLFHECASCV